MTKAQRKTETGPMEAPAADRVVTSADNMSPEKVPATLATADDLPTMMKADIDKVTTDAILQLDTYARVPDVIESDEIYQRVVTVSTQIKAAFDDIDNRKGVHKRPYLDAANAIETAFKVPYLAPGSAKDAKPRMLKAELEAAHKSLKARLSARDTVLHREEQKRQAEEQAKIAEAAAADGIEMTAPAPVATTVGTAKSVHGGMATRKIVKIWEVIDLEKLPRSLMMPDPEAIQKLLDGGATDIPGLKIEEVVDTITKRR